MKSMILVQRRCCHALIVLALLLVSCDSVRLISEYDEITDRTVTQMQQKVAEYFVKLERTIGTKEADYSNFTQNFDQIKVDLNTLEVRAAAIDKNRIVQDQVKELQKMVTSLEQLHKMGFVSTEQLKPLRQPFNTAFSAIIRLQMGLKRGEKSE